MKIRTLMLAASLAVIAQGAQAADPASREELLSVSRVTVAGQEVSLAKTRYVDGPRVKVCTQYVESFKREIDRRDMSVGGGDKVSIVLGVHCADS